MPATTAAASPAWYTAFERLEARKSHLLAQIADSKTATRYSRQGRQYRPLSGVCGEREMQIALEGVKRAATAGRHVTFDDALAELRRGAK